ncbi:MAG: hypothetical protein H0T65_10320, partial [Deltaproteobacteria bacterium]|nr:hypothetical protein [Deltaproteobacteria bacterium]
MYRYGDGTPFPLEENFIETLTSAVETCTNAFVPLSELDARRERAKDTRREAEKEAGRLDDLEKTINAALLPYLPTDKLKANGAQLVAQKLAQSAKSFIVEAKSQVDTRVRQMEAQASGRTSADAVVKALRPFF